jgi:hypothetical protein
MYLQPKLVRENMLWQIKRITVPLENDHLLLVTTEVEADHRTIINNVLKLVQHSSDNYMSDA